MLKQMLRLVRQVVALTNDVQTIKAQQTEMQTDIRDLYEII